MNPQLPITVVARWQTSADNLSELIRLATQLRQHSLQEPDCIGYEIYQHTSNGEVLVFEQYANSAAIETHRRSTHYRELLEQRIRPLLSGRQVELLQAASPRD